MKKHNIIFTALLLVCMTLCGCGDYPKYELHSIQYVPDSLKEKHRTWIMETVRASNQHLSAGDYENVPQTIQTAKWIADELFSASEPCLRRLDGAGVMWYDVSKEYMTKNERIIFDSLSR